MPKLQPGALTRGTIRFYLVTQTLIRQPSSWVNSPNFPWGGFQSMAPNPCQFP